MSLLRTIALLISVSILILISSCGRDNDMTDGEAFDRKAMLTDWADDIIIPAYASYVDELDLLETQMSAFVAAPDETSLENLRSQFIESYLAWQSVAIYDIGRAEEIGLRNFTNIYPTDTTSIQAQIASQDYNLELPSSFVTQGFPAIDFLLHGLSSDDSVTLDILSQQEYLTYLTDVVTRMQTLGTEVYMDWTDGFRTEFIDNDGSSATASVDKLVNDFLFYYERFLRAGKVGIPAGVFSGSPISNSVEAPYSGIYSKQLFEADFKSTRDFFEGRSFDQSTNGISLRDYLEFIRDQNESVDIAEIIINQWQQVDAALPNVGDDFRQQVIEDNNQMLALYDELQEAVIPLKVDMLQALNIQIDFVDADGD